MKFFVFCLLVGIAYADVSTQVTVNKDAIDGSGMSEVTFPCEYVMLPSEDQPPIIYWIKGVSVDDPEAVVIFKGYRYWNESLGEYRQFFNGYDKRASVPDLKVPSLKLAGVNSDDEGRYWCMVAEWSGRQQQGTDAASVALLLTTTQYTDSETDAVNITASENDDVSVSCSGSGNFNVVTWYQGPFHLPDTENFTYTEIGSYEQVGVYYHNSYLLPNGTYTSHLEMNPEYPQLSIDSSMSLTVTNAQISDSGRYWCELSSISPAIIELETDRASIEIIVHGEPFDCTGQPAGLYPDKNDCSMYYECVSGDHRTYHRSCGYDGLVFDERNGYCDWAANVPPPCGTMSEA